MNCQDFFSVENNNKKKLQVLSAAVKIGALRVNVVFLQELHRSWFPTQPWTMIHRLSWVYVIGTCDNIPLYSLYAQNLQENQPGCSTNKPLGFKALLA